uniref:Cytochrome c oxidase subunit 3 n=1 Tax=Anterhynchium abdominale TaxID=1589846 RepID=A0A6M9AWP7_9HYME|nr:cytochrome c oxidase subunit III [Anterhynchium abdominale]
MNLTNHPFHLVTLSPWPILLSFNLMFLFIGFIKWFNYYNFYLMMYSFLLLFMILLQWWRDVTRESTFQGCHTMSVINNMRMGMILFIISEIFFFISLFWTYFHSSLAPSIEIGMLWPPKGIKMFNPYDIPLLNSIILISSGMTISWSHYSMISNKMKNSFLSLNITILLGLIFSFFQYIEYNEAPFTISDSSFGSIFFLTTGFHGLHVIIGTMFLIICSIRMISNHFSFKHHFGFEAAIWYWHFVDIVWLFVYSWIYWWSF